MSMVSQGGEGASSATNPSSLQPSPMQQTQSTTPYQPQTPTGPGSNKATGNTMTAMMTSSTPSSTSTNNPFGTPGPMGPPAIMNGTSAGKAGGTPGGHGVSYPNPNIQNDPYIYLAVYSSVPVYEMMVRGIGVMRRRSDSFLNATQILKVAGVDKGKRTKILEKDIAMGRHEKVQGGYGRYQGTWIPFERAVELANQFSVSHLLSPLFDYTPPPPPASLAGTQSTPGKDGEPEGQSAATILNKAREQGLLPEAGSAQRKRSRDSAGSNATPEELKRAKVDSNGLNGHHYGQPYTQLSQHMQDGMTVDEEEADDDDLLSRVGDAAGGADASWKLRRSTKPHSTNGASIVDDAARMERHKTTLKSIFAMDALTTPVALGNTQSAVAPTSGISGVPGTSPNVPQALDFLSTFPPDIDPDTPIDDHDHTALHWAAALARIPIVQGLINFGADLFRGNNVGETPLMRAVLVTNNSDQDIFPRLLEILGPSLRTVDDTGRTVLHHAALVAGVKGRASSARYYMESVLEYVAKYEKGQFKSLIDAQDTHGDTTLNIAARVGNKGLVRMLLEVGADKLRANKLGLRPGDFGIEGMDLVPSAAEDAIAGIQSAPPVSAPAQKSQQVIADLTNLIENLSSEFAQEVKDRTDALYQTRQQLRIATRELADQRKEVSVWRKKVTEVDQRRQRIRNLERALNEEEQFDWTGRTEIDGTPAVASVGPGFTYRGQASTLSNLPVGISIEFDADPPPPPNDSEGQSLVHLLRLDSWYDRVLSLLQQRIERLEGGHVAFESSVQKLVAQCCGVEPERVEGMLEALLAALESDGSVLELSRVAAFLSRVKDGSLL